MKKYKLYLFDFDGTLLDTMPALSYVFTYCYAQVGVKFDPKDTQDFARIPLSVGYKKIGAPQELFKEFCKHIDLSLDFPEAISQSSPYEETMEFVKYLKENQIHAGIVTSNNVKHVQDVLKVVNIPVDTFEIYIGNKEVERFKPDPDPINKALIAAGPSFTKQDVVYVGDGMNDAISANNAGIDAVIVDRHEEFPDSDKYIRIKNLLELFK